MGRLAAPPVSQGDWLADLDDGYDDLEPHGFIVVRGPSNRLSFIFSAFSGFLRRRSARLIAHLCSASDHERLRRPTSFPGSVLFERQTFSIL